MTKQVPSNSNDAADIERQLLALRQDFAQKLPLRWLDLESLLGVAMPTALNDSAWSRVIGQFHSLAGSAGTFGFHELSTLCRAMEMLLVQAQTDEQPVSKAFETMAAKLPQIEALMKNPVVPESSQSIPLSSRKQLDGVHKPLVYVVDDETSLMQLLTMQINQFGYRVAGFSDLGKLADAITQERPDAIVCDVVFPSSHLGGPEFMFRLQSSLDRKVPVIFMSGRTDQESRLNAVRAGGDAYLVKPVDITELIDRLDNLLGQQNEEACRVLIVEDSPALSQLYAATLKQAGIHTHEVNHPKHLLDQIMEFGPDLILMDLYMPDWSGVELATMIRQQETFLSVPIVFLSSEPDVDKQLLAMRAGGDDFLSKPIKLERLIASVQIRAQRYANLRRMMVQDSLTGLLNHTKTEELLLIEITRAKRSVSSMAFVMVDLDFFKRVNDTHGHPTGDRVLKSMAQMFKQRLRKTDVIGRYGGEEFALILPDVTGEQALKVVNDLRTRFAEIEFAGVDGPFHVTLSAGIACYPQFNTPQDLTSAADLALYQAKRAGRNQVILQG